MPQIHAALAVLASAFLMSCAGDEPVLLAVPPTPATETVRIAYRTLEVRDVTLPSYAANEEIFIQAPDSTLQSAGDLIWADDPERAVALQLARDLAQITGARAASSPWPFAEPPQAQIEVRIEEFVADATGQFRLTGQYFVAPGDGLGSDRSGLFHLEQPYVPDAGPQALAAARSAVVAQLAALMAHDGLR